MVSSKTETIRAMAVAFLEQITAAGCIGGQVSLTINGADEYDVVCLFTTEDKDAAACALSAILLKYKASPEGRAIVREALARTPASVIDGGSYLFNTDAGGEG